MTMSISLKGTGHLLNAIKGHLTTIVFVFATIGSMMWFIVKPYADEYIYDRIKEQGLASASSVQSIEKELKEQTEKTGQIEETLDDLDDNAKLLQKEIEHIQEQQQENNDQLRQDLKEIREILLRRP